MSSFSSIQENFRGNSFSQHCALLKRLFLTLLLASNLTFADTESEIWIEIDTSKLQLAVMKKGTILLLFNDISIGRFGASQTRMLGSNLTPIGTFKISSIRDSQRFYKFFGIDFPNREIADLALQENKINLATWEKIITAIDNNQPVPQNTPLGGHLGIHGTGKGDLAIHQRFNWTNGCIALTNTQINQLSRWVKRGMRVIIF